MLCMLLVGDDDLDFWLIILICLVFVIIVQLPVNDSAVEFRFLVLVALNLWFLFQI